MRQIDILGMQLKDYSLREAIRMVNQFLNNGALNTVAYLSNQALIAAQQEPQLHEWIEELDMPVFGNTDILNAAGIDNWNRIHEVENDDFFKEFMKRLLREHKSVYLVADSQREIAFLQKRILQEREHMKIVGTYLLDDPDGGLDSMINEINDVAPNVIVSCLPFEHQLGYMHDYRKMINADIWLGLLKGHGTNEKGSGLLHKLIEKYRKQLFHHKQNQYAQEQKKE